MGSYLVDERTAEIFSRDIEDYMDSLCVLRSLLTQYQIPYLRNHWRQKSQILLILNNV